MLNSGEVMLFMYTVSYQYIKFNENVELRLTSQNQINSRPWVKYGEKIRIFFFVFFSENVTYFDHLKSHEIDRPMYKSKILTLLTRETNPTKAFKVKFDYSNFDFGPFSYRGPELFPTKKKKPPDQT